MGKVVFTNGCFDILHVGHFNILSYCRMVAGPDGKVVVGLDSDRKIKETKGDDRPFFTHMDRMCALMELKGENGKLLVNEIHPFDTDKELYELIRKVHPDVIVKGKDWDGNVIGSDMFETLLYPRSSYSSTQIVERIQSKHNCSWAIIDQAVKMRDLQDELMPECTCSLKWEDGQWWHTTEACYGQKRIPPPVTDIPEMKFVVKK